MPCVEIADSIVQSGRETLEKVNIFYQLNQTLINTPQEYRINREDPSMGRQGRLWRHRLFVRLTPRQDESRSIPNWAGYG